MIVIGRVLDLEGKEVSLRELKNDEDEERDEMI